MIDSIIQFSIRHRFVVISASVLIALLGVWSAWETPVDAIPDLSENQVLVFAEWQGHGPREIEDQVTYPLSLGLQGLRSVRVVRSTSEVGFALISVIYEDGVAIAEGRRRVAERLARVREQLPEGARAELAPDAPATGQIYWYTLEGGGLDLGRLRAIQDWYVGPQLSSVPGVAEVAGVGGYPVEYEVAVDPGRLLALGITLQQVYEAVSRANSAAGGHVIHRGNAEFVVRGVGWLGASKRPGDTGFDPRRAVRDLENVALAGADGRVARVSDVARVAIAPGFRRGALEKDGSEATGGVVLMANGENPLEVTRRIKARIRELEPGLPSGVKIVPFYDRTPLILGAIDTVRGAVIEAILSASICVLIILVHVRTSLIIAITLPLAALSSFLIMAALRSLGIVDIQANAMSLAGIAISVGVLVDSSVVMAENVMHRLHDRYGDVPVRGDVRETVLPACLAVGRPIVFSVAIMLLSFLPVFALGGIEGKMFHPLAFTKSFALLAVAGLSITLVPALCTIFIRGRLRSEQDNPLVRSIIDVYRPVLSYLMDHPVALAWILAATFLLGLAPLGYRPAFLATLFLSLVATVVLARSRLVLVAAPISLLVIALLADQCIEPLAREFMTPLDEGMMMDMPITVPRASVTESVDDLKARDMILCRFPEVDMVVGKAGRADTPTDPAPLDMIESMVCFRPREFWPRRKLTHDDARAQASAILNALIRRGAVADPGSPAGRDALIDPAVEAALAEFDVAMRDYAYQRNQQLVRDSSGLTPRSLHPDDEREAKLVPLWRAHVKALDGELLVRAPGVFTRFVMEELLARSTIVDPGVAANLEERRKLRARGIAELAEDAARLPDASRGAGGHHHHRMGQVGTSYYLTPNPTLDAIQAELAGRFGRRLMLWQVGFEELTRFDGELDRSVQMPGWTNVWTMPIQNRVDMLATGVNTPVGIRVLGHDLDQVVNASEAIAAIVRKIPGAADVVADPIRGKPYLEIRFDRERAAELGVSVGEANAVIEAALAGKVATTTVEGRERHPVVVRFGRDWRQDEDAIRGIMIPTLGVRGPAHAPSAPALADASIQERKPGPRSVPLGEIAEVRVVEGPASIKGENGLLRNYVRLNVRGRDTAEFVAEAREIVAREAALPGVFIEWTGQFEHEQRSRRTLLLVVPVVVLLIFLILYWTYRDLADATLMLLAVPGAIVGGLLFQWFLGLKLSVTVWVGYIACFGMATSTGIIMLVYLREAIEEAGGLPSISLTELRQAVLKGAVHRLRPKLLTEGTVVIGLAPVLWSSGVASEIIRPMAAPVMGGILVADEVIDLLLPVLFYWVRRARWHRLHGNVSPSDDTSTNKHAMPPFGPEPQGMILSGTAGEKP
jgi:Cu(I)/Ag(I) efflux system membrane protein CusA/SilA